MKILFLSADLCDGGAQRVTSIISGKLADKGLDIYMYLFCKSEKDYPINPQIKLEVMCKDYEEYSVLSGIQRTRYLRDYLKRIQPDVAIGFLQAGYALYLSSVGMSFKKIASLRNNPQKMKKAGRLREYLNNIWFRNADAIVLQTESQRRYAEMHKWKRTVVIPNPVNERAIYSIGCNYNLPCRKIIMVGRLVKQKNYQLAIEAMKDLSKQYQDLVLYIYGDGPQKEELKNKILQYGLQNIILLCGWERNIIEKYENSALYLLTSDYEGMPNALMEAMAVGLPCIATDCPTGPADLIKNKENGLLIQMNNVKELVCSIRKIIDMTCDERKEMGMRARKKIVTEYNCDVIAKKWERLLMG